MFLPPGLDGNALEALAADDLYRINALHDVGRNREALGERLAQGLRAVETHFRRREAVLGARIERRSSDAVYDDQPPVALEPRRHGEEDFFLIEDVHVFVEDEHMLVREVSVHGCQRGDLSLALDRLAN